MAKIVLDPGHGGTTEVGGSSPNNAVGPTGLLEKTITLDLAFRTEALLAAKGHIVVFTRKTDNNVGLADRAKAAKSIAAPVFVSIHLNGFDHKVQGTETICDNVHTSRSADLCRAVQKSVRAATGHNDRNASHPGGVKRQPLGVLKTGSHHADTACCLVEISFMDVADEEARLRTKPYLNKIATALAAGITDYVGAGGIEAVSAAASFEDGFSAEGGVAPDVTLETAARGRARRAARAPRLTAAEKAAMNDVKEFSRVAVGAGFDPEAAGLEGMPETLGFDMAQFEDFVQGLGLRHFSAAELLFMGNSNAPGGACAGRNHLPSEDLWPRIAKTAQMLDEIRHRLDAPCRILSAYRSPAYNDCIGGESASLHMKFNAIDFHCDAGSSTQWHAVAKAVRASDPGYLGGIGKYNSFVHIDTRGSEANWTG